MVMKNIDILNHHIDFLEIPITLLLHHTFFVVLMFFGLIKGIHTPHHLTVFKRI